MQEDEDRPGEPSQNIDYIYITIWIHDLDSNVIESRDLGYTTITNYTDASPVQTSYTKTMKSVFNHTSIDIPWSGTIEAKNSHWHIILSSSLWIVGDWLPPNDYVRVSFVNYH